MAVRDAWSTRGADRKRVTEQVRARRHGCHYCNEPIDYTLKWPNPGAFTVSHLKPRALYPELTFDLANLASAHWECNSAGGGRKPNTKGAVTSRNW